MSATWFRALAAGASVFMAVQLSGQPLPEGSYGVQSIDFVIGAECGNLQQIGFMREEWIASPTGSLWGSVVEATNPYVIGLPVSVVAIEDPYFSIRYSDGGLHVLPVRGGFVDAQGSTFTLRSSNLRFPVAPLTRAVLTLGMRNATSLIPVDVVGSWEHFYWGMSADMYSGQFIRQDFTRSRIAINQDGTGFREVLATSEEGEEDHGFTWTIEGGTIYVPEVDAYTAISASKDLMLSSAIDNGAFNTREVGVDLALRTATVLNANDLVGSWGHQNLHLIVDPGGECAQARISMNRGVLELAPDGTGTYYLMSTFEPARIEDLSESCFDFNWTVDGNSLLIQALGDDDVGEFYIGASLNTLASFQANHFSGFSEQEASLFLRQDIEIPAPVRAIPIFATMRDGWGDCAFSGRIYCATWPWAYHERTGWFYCAGGNGRRLWIYDLQLGWLLTDPLMFPWFFGPEAGEIYYLYFTPTTVPEHRHFYAVHSGQWIGD